MKVPIILYGTEVSATKNNNVGKIQEVEIKFLRSVKGCIRFDKIKKE
jgi:hypothetical protein